MAKQMLRDRLLISNPVILTVVQMGNLSPCADKMGAKPTRPRGKSTNGACHTTPPARPLATAMLLQARAPPPPLAANYSPSPERALHLRSKSSSRAVIATASAAAKPAAAASSRGGQRRKQVASVANPLVKHCVKLRLSAAYRCSCRRLLLVGLAPILYSPRFQALATSDPSREASRPSPVLRPLASGRCVGLSSTPSITCFSWTAWRSRRCCASSPAMSCLSAPR
ncbi:putative tRNA/rRNA methyltransferase YsgA-like [Panicum miliaceum]|uniref:tRNA/rRNA methyltransferase YsgA-like n=1 Tax=Panicum miliaceum TaxID=4540 RepID=A0A3L6TMF0_PANMI|nr:putative tRNA/rRNA methyltransferase YsgA-like [Panicum miliaceum]